MMNALEIALLIALFGSAYSYFVYPVILRAFAARGNAAQPKSPESWPAISVIVAARNEAGRIREKIENCLALDYPGPLEILICSDASDDGTDAIVARHASDGVRLIRADSRLGKEHAQWLGIQAAAGEIILFTDVATRIEPQAPRRLAEYFADPEIGAVSSEDRYLDADGKLAGEGAYVRYEMWLRGLESRAGGLIGLSGSFFAARAEICRHHWDTTLCSDFNTALGCYRHNLRAVTAPDVHGYYPALADDSQEYARKRRTALRGMTALHRHREMLNISEHGLFAFQLWSHKVMRWAVPWFMAAALVLSIVAAPGSLFAQTALAGQLAFYLIAAAGLWPAARRFGAVRIPFYFVQVNLALAHAAVWLLRGQQLVVWQPSLR